MNNRFYPFVNTPLPYAYGALEPFIDEKTMELHHDRHLQTYINNLNAILEENPGLQGLPLDQLIYYSGRLPVGLRTEVRNNAGGVYNHRFFFEGMMPGTCRRPFPECLPKQSTKNGEALMPFERNLKRPRFPYSVPVMRGSFIRTEGRRL